MAKYIGQTPEFKINGVSPDADGRFDLSLEELNAAHVTHFHDIADVVGLQDAIDSLAPIDHTHDYVTGIELPDGNTVTGNLIVEGSGDLVVTASGRVVTLTAQAPSVAVTSALLDVSDGTTQIKTFVGTQAEWDAITPDPAIRYLVYIHD